MRLEIASLILDANMSAIYLSDVKVALVQRCN